MSAGFVDDYRDVSVSEEGVDDVDAVPMIQFSEVGAISGLHRAFEGRSTEVGLSLYMIWSNASVIALFLRVSVGHS